MRILLLDDNIFENAYITLQIKSLLKEFERFFTLNNYIIEPLANSTIIN